MSDSNSRRPRVVCHMTTAIDGRVVVDGWRAQNATPGALVLEHIERFDDGFVWLRYRTARRHG